MHRKYVAIACTVGKLLKEKLRDPKAESLPDELAGLARKLDETSSRVEQESPDPDRTIEASRLKG
jgi:hypothetical protein